MTSKISELKKEIKSEHRFLSGTDLWNIISSYYPSRRGRAWAKNKLITELPLLKFRNIKDKRKITYVYSWSISHLLEKASCSSNLNERENIIREINTYIEWLESEYKLEYLGEWF